MVSNNRLVGRQILNLTLRGLKHENAAQFCLTLFASLVHWPQGVLTSKIGTKNTFQPFLTPKMSKIDYIDDICFLAQLGVKTTCTATRLSSSVLFYDLHSHPLIKCQALIQSMLSTD